MKYKTRNPQETVPPWHFDKSSQMYLFITNQLSATSLHSSNLFINCIAAIKELNTVHKDVGIFNGLKASKNLLYFQWAATHSKTKNTIYFHISSGHVKQFGTDLVNQNILSSTATSLNEGILPELTNATFTHLSSFISKLSKRLKQDSSDRQSDKANKKEKLRKTSTSF